METTSPAFLSPVFWQKRPIQVTTTNKDKWQEGFPESPGPSVSVNMNPSSQPFCVAGGKGVAGHSREGFLFLKPGGFVIPVSLITNHGLCPIRVKTAPLSGQEAASGVITQLTCTHEPLQK